MALHKQSKNVYKDTKTNVTIERTAKGWKSSTGQTGATMQEVWQASQK